MSKKRICLITYPFSKSTKVYNLLFDMIDILEPISKLYIITGNLPENKISNRKINLINFKFEKELRRNIPFYKAFPIWFINYIIGQIKISYYLLKINRDVDIIFFYLGWSLCLFPMLLSKIIGKNTLIIITGSESRSGKINDPRLFNYIQNLFEKISYKISDYLVPESRNIVQDLNLNKYANKILNPGYRFVDTKLFNIKIPINRRKNLVGYVGRFSKEKGIINFIDSIQYTLNKNMDINFLIIGDGPLSNDITKKIKTLDNNKITLVQWVTHENLPNYLNELKLIVVPSYTEGLPTIVLEAMACGTPVLATPVGGITDIIIDGKTGFILGNNDPKHISNMIVNILHSPLGMIVNNEIELIEKDFTYQAAVERYKTIIKKLDNQNLSTK